MPGQVVITERIASKYFKDEDPIGKIFIFTGAYDKISCEVTGVMKEMPSNSHIHYSFLISYKSLPKYMQEYWYKHEAYTYVLLDSPERKAEIEREFPVMAEMGFFPIEKLNSYEEDNGLLVGHQRNLDLGLEYASLSLGMELSFAVGKSIYAKQNNLPYHVYVLLGDAECNEGSIWEAVLTAGHYKLDNLTVIVDRNYMAVDGNTEDWMAQMDMELKFKSFGWESKTVNGHSVEQLIDSLQYRPIDKPYALIAETVKGKGVSFMENNKLWHQAVLSEEQYKTAYAEILNS